MRNSEHARWIQQLDHFGSRRSDPLAQRGDIIFAQPGPAQFHLGLWTGDSLIHADARLGRVVETPGDPAWPIIGIWSLFEGTL